MNQPLKNYIRMMPVAIPIFAVIYYHPKALLVLLYFLLIWVSCFAILLFLFWCFGAFDD